MIAFLLSLLTRAKGVPLWAYLTLGVAATFGIREWQHSRDMGRLEREKAALEQTIQSQIATIANLHVSVSQERLNVGTLEARIREQNHAIQVLGTTAKAKEQASALAVVRALAKGKADAAARLKADTPSGHAALNAEALKIWEAP